LLSPKAHFDFGKEVKITQYRKNSKNNFMESFIVNKALKSRKNINKRRSMINQWLFYKSRPVWIMYK